MKRQFICSGYQIKDGKIVIDHKESKVIRKIFELACDGHSAFSIAKTLNAEGVKTLINGKSWYHGNILIIIRNNKYIGEGEYPRIIKTSIFKQANENFKFVSKKQKNANHVLYGTIKCKTCGSIYRRYEKNGEVFWACPTTMCHGARICKKEIVRDKDIVNIILNTINTLVKNPEKIEMNPQAVKFHNEANYKRMTTRMETQLCHHSDVEELLSIAQEKAQMMYAGYDEIDDQYHYEKICGYLENRKPYKSLDASFIKQCIKEITIDVEEHLLTIVFINNQQMISQFNTIPCPS